MIIGSHECVGKIMLGSTTVCFARRQKPSNTANTHQHNLFYGLFFFVCHTAQCLASDMFHGLRLLTRDHEGNAEGENFSSLVKAIMYWQMQQLPMTDQYLMPKYFFLGLNGRLLNGPSG